MMTEIPEVCAARREVTCILMLSQDSDLNEEMDIHAVVDTFVLQLEVLCEMRNALAALYNAGSNYAPTPQHNTYPGCF